MSKGWYVKVAADVVFTMDTNIGVVAETEEKAGLEAQTLLCKWLVQDEYKDELEKTLPWSIEMGGDMWSRGPRSGDIDFDTMQVVSIEPDTNFNPEGDDEAKEDAALVRDLMEAAQCLNEAYHSLPKDHPLRVHEYWLGIADVRDQLNRCAIYCDNLYRYVMSEQGYDNSFDFNFVPQFLENCVDHQTFKPKAEKMQILFLYFNGATKWEYKK